MFSLVTLTVAGFAILAWANLAGGSSLDFQRRQVSSAYNRR